MRQGLAGGCASVEPFLSKRIRLHRSRYMGMLRHAPNRRSGKPGRRFSTKLVRPIRHRNPMTCRRRRATTRDGDFSKSLQARLGNAEPRGPVSNEWHRQPPRRRTDRSHGFHPSSRSPLSDLEIRPGLPRPVMPPARSAFTRPRTADAPGGSSAFPIVDLAPCGVHCDRPLREEFSILRCMPPSPD